MQGEQSAEVGVCRDDDSSVLRRARKNRVIFCCLQPVVTYVYGIVALFL